MFLIITGKAEEQNDQLVKFIVYKITMTKNSYIKSNNGLKKTKFGSYCQVNKGLFKYHFPQINENVLTVLAEVDVYVHYEFI